MNSKYLFCSASLNLSLSQKKNFSLRHSLVGADGGQPGLSGKGCWELGREGGRERELICLRTYCAPSAVLGLPPVCCHWILRQRYVEGL